MDGAADLIFKPFRISFFINRPLGKDWQIWIPGFDAAGLGADLTCLDAMTHGADLPAKQQAARGGGAYVARVGAVDLGADLGAADLGAAGCGAGHTCPNPLPALSLTLVPSFRNFPIRRHHPPRWPLSPPFGSPAAVALRRLSLPVPLRPAARLAAHQAPAEIFLSTHLLADINFVGGNPSRLRSTACMGLWDSK